MHRHVNSSAKHTFTMFTLYMEFEFNACTLSPNSLFYSQWDSHPWRNVHIVCLHVWVCLSTVSHFKWSFIWFSYWIFLLVKNLIRRIILFRKKLRVISIRSNNFKSSVTNFHNDSWNSGNKVFGGQQSLRQIQQHY